MYLFFPDPTVPTKEDNLPKDARGSEDQTQETRYERVEIPRLRDVCHE
jgi:hypothetical protein